MLEAFTRLLKPGGLLVIGPGEVINYESKVLRRVESKNVLGYINPVGSNDIG
jgi:chemotaxis methyl-accepting protein methylase